MLPPQVSFVEILVTAKSIPMNFQFSCRLLHAETFMHTRQVTLWQLPCNLAIDKKKNTISYLRVTSEIRSNSIGINTGILPLEDELFCSKQ